MYTENHKTLLREIKNGDIPSLVHDQKKHKDDNIPQSDIQTQGNPYQNLNCFFTEVEKPILKVHIESQRTPENQNNFENDKLEDLYFLILKHIVKLT